MLTYQEESWFTLIKEGLDMFQQHWEELDSHVNPKLDIDFDGYADLALNNKLHIITIRDNSKLVGYSVNVIQPTLHFRKVKWAFADFFFILPEYRKGFAGVKLFKEVERTLKNKNVSRIFMGTRLDLNLERIFNRLGYTEFQRTYIKDLT